MTSLDLSPITSRLQPVIEKFDGLSPEAKIAVGVAGAGASIYVLSSLFSAKSRYRAKPGSFDLSGGSIAKGQVNQEFQNYSSAYGKEPGQGVIEKEKTPALVDVFYSLVTDIYEWGWGQSFHFSPKLPGKDHKASEAAHETRIATALNLKPGMKCLDAGCGVGGPMRTIAAVGGAHVTGITINEYQVQRAKHHNKQHGLEALTDVVKGNFMEMPFADATFDAAYAIEATCHAPDLVQVYSEIHRVLKPGALFASYEWVSTAKFDSNNPEHVKIIDEINFGNGLPAMRTWKEAEAAGKTAGFELVTSIDLAGSTSPTRHTWYHRLCMPRFQHHINHSIVTTLDFLGVAPKGLKDVHKMLVDVAGSLCRGGETEVFTPMHFLVFRKL